MWFELWLCTDVAVVGDTKNNFPQGKHVGNGNWANDILSKS